jgi:hypothetical protein
VLRFIISHTPGGKHKHVLITSSKLLSSRDRLHKIYAYFSDRTGPDFMHPIYTLGFNACFDKICPSVAANAELQC